MAGDEETPSRAEPDPTPGEERAAERALDGESEDEREEVATHYREMTDIGANVKGEGELP